MAAPPCSRPSSSTLVAAAPRTTSSCTTETWRGTHVFRVYQYSALRGLALAPATSVMSGIFTVGGIDWAIRLAPVDRDVTLVYVVVARRPPLGRSLFDGEVKVMWELSLVDQITGRPCPLGGNHTATTLSPMSIGIDGSYSYCPAIRTSALDLPGSPYLRNDRLDIRCDVTVIAPRVSETLPLPVIAPPPPGGLSNDLGALLEKEHGTEADVTFHVRGESFQAHRAVLAARSPVFMAELLRRPTVERETGHVTVEDVQPAVFGALLHFIYTDDLPPVVDDLDGDDRTEMLRHLLVAADRYDVGRLRGLCESLLCENLDVEAAEATLGLAELHHCDRLGEACREFLHANTSQRVRRSLFD